MRRRGEQCIRFQASKATNLEGVIVCLLIASIILSAQSTYQLPNYTQSTPRILGSPSQTDTPVKEYALPQGSGPSAIAYGASHILWFTDYESGKIGEFFPQNHTSRTFIVPKFTQNQPTPTALALDGQGRVWFTDENQSAVWMFDPANTTFIPHATKTPKSTPFSVLVDLSGNIWFTENSANNLGVILSPTYSILTEYSLPSSNSGPAGLALQSGSSNLWLTEDFPNGDQVAKFDTSSHSFQEYRPSFAVNSPVGIVFDKAGNIWFTEHYASSIDEFFPSNQSYRKFPTSLPATASSQTYSAPATIAIDNQSRLWFEEHLTNKVGRLDPMTGTMEEFLIPTQGAYSLQSTLDSAGNFWFTEYYADKIGMVPSNATSYLTVRPKPLQSAQVVGGQTAQGNVLITNKLATSIHLELTGTSSFTPLGMTPTSELMLNATSVDLGPGQTVTVAAVISPARALPSGWYSVGIAADYTNASSSGILFLQVQSNPTILDLLSANMPEVVFASAVVLGGVYIILKLRANTDRTKAETHETKLAHMLEIALGGLVSLLLISRYQPITVAGKCIGPTAPSGGFDLFSILLLSVGVAIVAVILFFGVRDILRWRREQAGIRKQQDSN